MNTPQTRLQSDADRFAADFTRGFEELQASRRFTAEQLEVIYALAYSHVQQQQWQKALAIFAFLSQYGPTRSHYLAGLALCLQMVQRHDEAINIHSLMLVLFPEQLAPLLHIAESQLALGERAAAVKTLQQLDAALPAGVMLQQRAQALLERLASTASA
ncbi:tetratricopeptide repeat protein [Comamonas flocculans]|uniref:tetratricopeptide repeat protein n=1 Tax=Comamonas flocculans TaxID=2597701 RepID=UPI0016465D41|nr:tetratricopeptide repeat protein [Comamonas flocculans]